MRECRAESIIVGHEYGIWGGLDEDERKRKRKELRGKIAI
jgi:hypothetical protein